MSLKYLWSLATVVFYTVIRMSELLLHATVYLNLTNKNFNKGSQTPNKTYCIILLKQCSKTEKKKKTKNYSGRSQDYYQCVSEL